MHSADIPVKGKWRKRHLGGHDAVRRMDRQAGVLIWCRKCSGCARQKLGPELMNCCKPEQVGTKQYGKMLKRIQVLEEGSVPAKEARNWKIQGQERRTSRKECQRLLNKFEMEGFMAQKGLWNLDREKMLQDRGALPEEEGDIVREYKAKHEDIFLSSWLREDLVGKGKRKNREKKGWRGGKRKWKERGREKRRKRLLLKGVSTFFLSDAFVQFSPVDDSGLLRGFLGNFWLTLVVLRSLCLRCHRVWL